MGPFDRIREAISRLSHGSSKSKLKPETEEKTSSKKESKSPKKPQDQQTKADKAEFVKITNSAREAQIDDNLGT